MALVLLCAGCGGSSAVKSPPATYRGAALDPPQAAPGFTLTDQAGNTVSLASERGGWVVVTFLYTHCPDVCPVIAGKLNAALATPLARRTHLRVLAVSVDPTRDTHAAVVRYVRERGLRPPFRYLIGSPAQLRRVWHAYHIAVLPGAKGTVTHQAIEILVDPQGRERLLYDNENLPHLTSDLEHDLGLLA